MKSSKKLKASRVTYGLIFCSWLITACQAPQTQDPVSATAMPEALVPPPSPVSIPPEDIVLETQPPITSAPDPIDNAELDREIAQSYINSAKKNKPNPAASKNRSVASALIQKAVAELRSNQIAAAKANLMQAQTLDSSNATVYLYLSEVAIRERKPAEAQGLAQRGLLFSNSNNLTRGLWKMIQIAAQMQGNSKLASQAAIKANQS